MATDPETLVLFTNFFPYHRGEEYLESEFPYLREQFTKIVIVPVMYEKGMELSYDPGPNTVVITEAIDSRILGKLQYSISALPKLLLQKRLSPMRDMTLNPLTWVYDAYFTARSHELWRRVESKIRQVVGSDPLSVYAYRMYVTAYLGGMLRESSWANCVRMVTRAHGYDVLHERNRLGYLPQRRFILEHSDKVFAVSEEGAKVVREQFPSFSKKVGVEHLGVAENFSEPRKRAPKPTLVSVSTFQSVKRIPLVVSVVKELTQRGHDFEWVHFGAGPRQSERQIRSEILKLRIPDHVVQFKGYIKNTDLLDWYRNNEVSAFINLSRSEGVPVSIMEAFAAAIPVIATDVGGTGELVHDGENGRLVSEDATVMEIADAVETVIFAIDQTYSKMSADALNTWEIDWNASKNFSRFAKLLKGTVDA